MLGVEIDPDRAKSIDAARKSHIRSTSPASGELPEGYGMEWDEDFAYIAGFTAGGAPFGTERQPEGLPDDANTPVDPDSADDA